MKDFAAICQFLHFFHPAFALEDFDTEVNFYPLQSDMVTCCSPSEYDLAGRSIQHWIVTYGTTRARHVLIRSFAWCPFALLICRWFP